MVRHRTSPQNTPECRVPQCHLSASFRDCSVIITGAEQNSGTCVYKKPGRQILKEAYSDLELISKFRCPNPLRYHSAHSQALSSQLQTTPLTVKYFHQVTQRDAGTASYF